MNEIVRNPTPGEVTGADPITPIETPQGRVLTAEDKFRKLLAEKRLEAQQKGLPFAAQVAYDEWKTYYEEEVTKQRKKYGYVKEEIAPLKIDWNKYSDLKNFDLLEEGEILDDYLSKRYTQLIYVKKKVYQFKGYYYKYIVMEDGIEAVKRQLGNKQEVKSK